MTARLVRLRRRWRLLLRLGVAPPLAYFLANDLFDHQQAFFAPVAAVVVIIAGGGLRMSAVVELVVGVATGVLVGELLILWLGRGAWQMGLIVAIAVVVATLLGLKGLAFNQAVISSVLLASIVPLPGTNPAVTRFLDALVGGAIGLLFVLIVPRNPLRDIDREVQEAMVPLTTVLRKLCVALRTDDSVLADAALVEARDTQPLFTQLTSTAANVTEIAKLAPTRWRQRRHVDAYATAVPYLIIAVRNARVMARKISALLRHRELVPPGLAPAIEQLADAYAAFAHELVEQTGFDGSREIAVGASQLATRSLPGATSINGAAVAAQVRSLAADLMYATGLTRDDIDDLLGEA